MSKLRGKAGWLALVLGLAVAVALVWGVQAGLSQESQSPKNPGAAAGQGPSPSSSAAPPAPAYHGNTKTKKFHRAGCRYYYCQHCTAVFKTKEEALKAGYVPCKICRP